MFEGAACLMVVVCDIVARTSAFLFRALIWWDAAGRSWSLFLRFIERHRAGLEFDHKAAVAGSIFSRISQTNRPVHLSVTHGESIASAPINVLRHHT